jgi:hypothetical protein
MPLNPPGLESDLEALFRQPPPTAAACAQAWADAIVDYTTGVIPASTTVSGGKATLTSSLQAAFSSPDAAPGVDAAVLAFATTVAGGMAPTFTGTPPSAPLGIMSLLLLKRETHAEAAAAFASHIDTWMKTGTATLVAPPNTVVTWT